MKPRGYTFGTAGVRGVVSQVCYNSADLFRIKLSSTISLKISIRILLSLLQIFGV